MKKLDVAIAAALTAWMLAEVWAEHLRPVGIVAPTMVVAGAALVWRRSYPIAVMLVAIGAMLVQAAAGMTMHSAVSPVAALMLVSWSIGAYEERPRAALGLVLLVSILWLAMIVDVLRGTDHYVGTDYPWLGALLAFPGILGIAFGARTRSLHAAEARTRELELERREAVSEERARVARELHDVIAHSVSVMTVQAGAAEEMLKVDPARALDPVRAVQETGRQALVEMKRLVGMLRQGDEEIGLAPQPGVAEVERLVGQVREAGLPVELRVEGEPRALPLGVDLAAYRVVQEALTNALRHAAGAATVVTIRYGELELEVDVTDSGRASEPGAGGHGLVGMRERVGIFGGVFAAGPRPSGGFAVRAQLPLEGPVTSILLADDQALVRGGFRLILEAQPDFEVVAEAEDGSAAVERARELHPDVVLMDVRMPGLDGIAATRIVVEERLASHVLVLTTFDEDRIVYDALSAGASGFLLKAAPPNQLVGAVRTVAAGEALLAPTVTRRLIEEFVRRPAPDTPAERLAVLTERECEVLALIARGLSNAEIASSLFLSGATVKTHVNRIFSKLDLRDRVQAVVLAYETGLVRPGD